MNKPRTIENICTKCRHLTHTECPPHTCEKQLHKDYEPITKCKQFAEND